MDKLIGTQNLPKKVIRTAEGDIHLCKIGKEFIHNDKFIDENEKVYRKLPEGERFKINALFPAVPKLENFYLLFLLNSN